MGFLTLLCQHLCYLSLLISSCYTAPGLLARQKQCPDPSHTNLTEAWRSPVVMVMGRQYPQLHQATVPSPPDRARVWGKKDVGQFRMPCHHDKTRSQMVNVIRNEKSQSWCGSPPHHDCRADNVMRRKGICLLLYSVQQQLTDSDLGPPSTFLHPMYFLVLLTAPPGIS